MTFDEFQQAYPACRGVPLRRHLQIKYRNIRLVKSRTTNGRLEVVRSHNVVLITQGPIELLSDYRIIVNNQNSGLHPTTLLSVPGLLMSKARTITDLRVFWIQTGSSVHDSKQKGLRGVYIRKHYSGFFGGLGGSSTGSSSSPTSSITFNSAPNF